MNKNRKSGFDWASKLGLVVTNPKGWENDEQFTQELISKTEFLNRASASQVKSSVPMTRRAAAKLLKKI